MADDQKALELINTGVQAFEGILREILRASAVNPIMAFGSLMIISEIGLKLGLYNSDKRDKIDLFVGTVTAALVAADVIGSVVGAGALKPSATTVVYGADNQQMTAAVLGNTAVKP